MSFALVPLILAIAGINEADLPAPTIRQPVSAACLLSLARNDTEREQLKQEKYRNALSLKGETLSRLMAKQLLLIDENMRLYPDMIAQRRDLHDHGLITDKEFQDDLDSDPLNYAADVAEDLSLYPACGMIDGYPETPAKKAVLERVSR